MARRIPSKLFQQLTLMVLFAAFSCAQTGPTGTWRAEGTANPFPWEVALRADGPRLIGFVSGCGSGGRTEILDGKIEGNTIRFSCVNGSARFLTTLVGTITGDQIAFAQEQVLDRVQAATPPPGGYGLFGTSAPTKFIAVRSPDGFLASEIRDVVVGTDVAVAVNLFQKDIKAEAGLFIPERVTQIKVVVVAVGHGLGFNLFDSAPEWPKLAERIDGALLLVRFSKIGPRVIKGLPATDADERKDVLIRALQQLASETRHKELTDAPLVFWGHSRGAAAAFEFAQQFPERTLAFVRYHSQGPAQASNVESKIPALYLAGARDTTVGTANAQASWHSGRMAGAPWTFAIEPNAVHGNPKDLEDANGLMTQWIAGVARLRLSSDRTLRQVSEDLGWLGNISTGEFAPFSSYIGSKADATWLPDEATARAWQAVLKGGK